MQNTSSPNCKSVQGHQQVAQDEDLMNEQANKGKAKAHKGRELLEEVETGFRRWLSARYPKHSEPVQGYRIYDSVFVGLAPDLDRLNGSLFEIRTLNHQSPASDAADYDKQVDSVKRAIENDIHPRLNAKGSSGSYFVHDQQHRVVGIFKPKDEEPYGRLNPKWTKWLHRNLIAPIFPSSFGRSCLIPNLSYLSEAAACLLDRHLQLYIVPRTGVESLSSNSFFYDWIDRRNAVKLTNPKPLPPKPGSFQVFAQGFTDASDFLAAHPWPGRRPNDPVRNPGPRHKKRGWKLFRLLTPLCGKSEAQDEWAGDEDYDDHGDMTPLAEHKAPFFWTESLMQDFREQLERLVVLDYLMRNTDRGLDNFMLKYCPGDSPATCRVIDQQPRASEAMSNTRRQPSTLQGTKSRLHEPHIHMRVFLQEGGQSWRAYPYGWLFLPASLIGLPWSQPTRDHFTILLTDKTWWEELIVDLRQTFEKDKDFNKSMFRKQMAVLKGQALNLLQSLRDPEEGPLELCSRIKLNVWDDYIDKPSEEDEELEPDLAASMLSIPESETMDEVSETLPLISSPPASVSSKKRHRRSTDRPRGASLSDVPQIPHKVSSAKNIDNVSPGISLLEHNLARSVPTPSFMRPRSNSQSHERPTKPSHARMSSSGTLSRPILNARSTNTSSASTSLLAALGEEAEPEPERVVVERIEIVRGTATFASC